MLPLDLVGVEFFPRSEILPSAPRPSPHRHSVFCLSVCPVTLLAIFIITVAHSDVLPRMLASFLDSRSALWRALLDNGCHAGIAAASWMVVAALRCDDHVVLMVLVCVLPIIALIAYCSKIVKAAAPYMGVQLCTTSRL